MDTFYDAPLGLVESLLESLALIEGRKQLPVAQLTWLVGTLGGQKDYKTSDYLMPYAKPEDRKAPEWVLEDLRIAGELDIAPQALIEAVHS